MAQDNLSSFELITYSEAYQRAVERGFTGNKREFRAASTKQPDMIASKFGVQRDHSILNPAINQPTWRDLQTKGKETKRSKTKASKPQVVATKSSSQPAKATKATPAKATNEPELDLVRKLSTGIDFLSREVDTLRTEKETLKAEWDQAQEQKADAFSQRDKAKQETARLKGALEASQEEYDEQAQEKEEKIQSLEAEISSLQTQLADLKQTYQQLEPILQLVRTQSPEDGTAAIQADMLKQPSSNGTATKPKQKKSNSQKSTSSKKQTKASSTSTRQSTGTKSKATASTPTSKNGKKASKAAPKAKKASPPAKQENTDLDQSVVHALEAIMEYNNEPDRTFEEKWAISYPVMKELLTQVGASTQTKIKAVFDARNKDIEQHMKKHNLGKRHNRNHQGESISDILKLSV